MAILWPYRKLGVSQCPGWRNKAKPKSVTCKTNHKSDEAPVAYTAEVDMKNEPREAMGLADGAWESLIGRTNDTHIH